MNLLKRNLKIFLGLIGVTSNVTAQTQTNSVTLKNVGQIEVNEPNNIQLENYQYVSQEELMNSLENNKLEQLLLKKGILIQKPSADSTVCEKCITTRN